MLGDLGCDEAFLCHNKALLGPMSRPWTVSRPGMAKAGRPCVATGWRNRHAPTRAAVCATGTQCELQRTRDKDPCATEGPRAGTTGNCRDREALSRQTTHVVLSRQS